MFSSRSKPAASTTFSPSSPRTTTTQRCVQLSLGTVQVTLFLSSFLVSIFFSGVDETSREEVLYILQVINLVVAIVGCLAVTVVKIIVLSKIKAL